MATHGGYLHHGKGLPPTMQPPSHSTSMSVTWPRGYAGTTLAAVPPPSMVPPSHVSLRASHQQISADASRAVGAGEYECTCMR